MTDVVCAVFLRPERYVLACRRPFNKCEGGKWEFPGGKVELGESSIAALEREILEELGVIISVGEALTPVKHGPILLQPYCVEITEGVLTLHEHIESRWVALWEADSLDWAAADLSILAELQDSH